MVSQVNAHVSIVVIMRARSWVTRTAVDMGSSPIREQFLELTTEVGLHLG